MGIKDPALKKVIQKVEAFEHRMYSHPLHSDPNLESVYSLCEKKALVRNYLFVFQFVCESETLLNVKLYLKLNHLSTGYSWFCYY